MDTIPHEDQKYIEALLNNNSILIEEIYKKWGPDVKKFVLKNSGSVEEANDLFQESLEVVLDKARSDDFVLTVPFGGFLYFIYRNNWLNKLKRKRKKGLIIEELKLYNSEADSKVLATEIELFQKRVAVFKACFLKLSDKCQALLNARYEKEMDSSQMMELLKISTISSVNKGMFDCRKHLKKIIVQHPEFKNLYLD